jgi:hypothetical protein
VLSEKQAALLGTSVRTFLFYFQVSWAFSVGAAFQPRCSRLEASPTKNFLADKVALRAMACLKLNT